MFGPTCAWGESSKLPPEVAKSTLGMLTHNQALRCGICPTCACGEVAAASSELPLAVGESISGNASSGVVGLPDRRRPALPFLLPLHPVQTNFRQSDLLIVSASFLTSRASWPAQLRRWHRAVPFEGCADCVRRLTRG